MSLSLRIVLAGLKALTRLLCRIEDAPLKRVPARGPLIVVTNHTNILEVPLLYTHLWPRPVTCLVASYRWESPFFRWLLDGTGMIALHRGEADVTALRTALARLRRGEILIIAPEGTRNKTGRLLRAKAGVVPLALWSGAPLLPLVYHGHERFEENVRHLRRTDFHIVVGEPFRLETHGERVTRAVRQAMVDEIMRTVARLLPPANRGFYADLEAAPRYVVPLAVTS